LPATARWSTHPRRYASAACGPIPPDQRAHGPSPVAISAECDLVHSSSTSKDCQSFSVREFLNLDDGNRVILRENLEFTIGEPGADVHEDLDAESLTQAIRSVVLPAVSAKDPAHPWECIVQLARRRRVRTCAEELETLPYELVLTDAVRAWL